MKEELVTLSVGATSDKACSILLADLDRPLRVLDLGCGSGHFSLRLKTIYEARGWDAAAHLLAVDLSLASYGVPDVPAREIDLDRPLPFADASFDAVVAIEVLEHVRAPYLLFEELRRILAPGGRLIFTTPNVGNVTSRLSFLFGGRFRLYPTPTTDRAMAGDLVGHIQPLPVQYWHWGLRAAGFEAITVDADRIKKGASFLARLFWPLFRLGTLSARRQDGKNGPTVAAEVEPASRLVNAFETLSSRCLVIAARRP